MTRFADELRATTSSHDSHVPPAPFSCSICFAQGERRFYLGAVVDDLFLGTVSVLGMDA